MYLKIISFASGPQGKTEIVQSPVVLNVKSDAKPIFTQPTMYFCSKKVSLRRVSIKQVEIKFLLTKSPYSFAKVLPA